MKITELRNVTLGAEKHETLDGTPYWRLAFTEKDTGDTVFANFSVETVEEFVRVATGGIEIVRAV
jgi:hypothetical protein